jgi:hypothetical protein
MSWHLWQFMMAGIVFVSLTCCRALLTPPKELYLEDATGTATQDDVLKQWGRPQEERKRSGEQSVWVYRETLHGAYGHEECRAYELTFDGQILRRWNDAHC